MPSTVLDGLLPATRHVLAEVERLSGKGIEFLRDDKLGMLTTVQTARHGAPYHVVRYQPTSDPLDYLLVYQAGFLLRLFQCEPDQRCEFAPANDAGTRMELLLPASASADESLRARYADMVAKWALMTLRSMPIGMRIDSWIAATMPELAELQRAGIAIQQQQNTDMLSQSIAGLSVPKHLLAMNAAYAVFADRLLDDDRYAQPYAAMGLMGSSDTLLKIWEEGPSAPDHDCHLVDRWASALSLEGWYRWLPFQP